MTQTDPILLETPTGRHIVKGRNAWALLGLMEAKSQGVAPWDEPTGPRWSAYIFNLRQMGIEIETINESHGGAYPGSHARYILRTPCKVVNDAA